MEFLVPLLLLTHQRHCSGSTVRCCCARSATTIRLSRSNSWPHSYREMMYALFPPPPTVATLQFALKILGSCCDFIEHWIFRRRTTMRKLMPINTTWSRCTSCAGRARLLWSTTLNIRTDNFALFSSAISFNAAEIRTKALWWSV